MSIERTDTVDANVVRDGWAVLSIHHFGDWDEFGDLVEDLRRKLIHYFEFIESPQFLERAHRMPAKIELVCASEPPPEVAALCETYGVIIKA